MQRPSSCTPMGHRAASDIDDNEYINSSVRKRMLCRALNRRSLFQSMDNTHTLDTMESTISGTGERSRFDEIKVDLENAFDDLSAPVPDPVTPMAQPKACDECQLRANEMSELQRKYDKLHEKYKALKANSQKKVDESVCTIDFLSAELEVAKSMGLKAELNRPLQRKSDENAPGTTNASSTASTSSKSTNSTNLGDAKQKSSAAYDTFILKEINELKERLGKAESDNKELKIKFSKHLKTRI